MIFNSIDFAIFLPIVFFLYWFVFQRNLKAQNLLIVLASYVFYGWWDWRFLALIIFSTIVDYSIGKQLNVTPKQIHRKVLLWLSVLINIGFLSFFKYYNFFLENFLATFRFFGYSIQSNSLNIILPVGISFYTFQTLSYTIDIYKRKLEPTKDFVSFAAFVSFFPQLVAGPIERASNLLPQFFLKRKFDNARAVDGMRQILWGLFKKVVIADNCAQFVNQIFNNSEVYTGTTLFLGAIFFAFQIYGDFSGYSDMAIGTSRLFGFNLKQNFAFPYFSRDIAEFWRRWHISLTTWFRDYLYIPLGGSRGGYWIKIRNTFIIFIVSGFWHGANWNYIVWGVINAFYFLPLLLTNKNRNYLDIIAKDRYVPTIKEFANMSMTFFLITNSWIIFRAENMSQAMSYIYRLYSTLTISPGAIFLSQYLEIQLLILFFIGIEWLGRGNKHALEKFPNYFHKPIRWSFYCLLCISIYYFKGDQQEFIYFQF